MLVFLVPTPTPPPYCFWISLLKSRNPLTIPNILFGFSVFISSLEIFPVSSFKLLHLTLLSFTNSSFFFLSFVSNNFFAKSIGAEKLKYVLNKSLFTFSEFFSIKFRVLLMCFLNYSSDFSRNFSSDFASFVLNTLPLNKKIPFSKKPIIFSLTRNNSPADSRTLFFSFLFSFF